MRTEVQATAAIDKISRNFSDGYYLDMAKRMRGVKFVENFSVNYILLQDLRQNQQIKTFTDQQRDAIIDQLI